jgi:Protein of unknown function (DUF4089)
MNELNGKALDDLLIASLSVQGLDLSQGERDAILASLRGLADAFALLRAFPLPDEASSASVFALPR